MYQSDDEQSKREIHENHEINNNRNKNIENDDSICHAIRL